VSDPGIPRRLVAIAVAAGALAALAVAVVAGGTVWLDQYAVDHWMPELGPDRAAPPMLTIGQLHPHLGGSVESFFSLWTYPASALVSGLVLVACCVVLERRGSRGAAIAWAVAWVLANALEVVGKTTLQRPVLTVAAGAGRGALHAFDSSFPSGHAMRAVLTAALVATVWRRAALPAVVWAAVVLPALVVLGAHTPSDVIGGALVGLAAVLAVDTWLRAGVGAARRAPSSRAIGSAVAEDP
jgi:membrane-associated phospholipid phosphatase